MARLGSVGLFLVPFCAERRDNLGQRVAVFQLELSLQLHSMINGYLTLPGAYILHGIYKISLSRHSGDSGLVEGTYISCSLSAPVQPSQLTTTA